MLPAPLVGAAEGCDLLICFEKIKVKRSQPSAAPTGGGCVNFSNQLYLYETIAIRDARIKRVQ
ncbi:hypothetical protein EMIT0P218_30323 [Pseudomonas sp. IT-P218]